MISQLTAKSICLDLSVIFKQIWQHISVPASQIGYLSGFIIVNRISFDFSLLVRQNKTFEQLMSFSHYLLTLCRPNG